MAARPICNRRAMKHAHRCKKLTIGSKVKQKHRSAPNNNSRCSNSRSDNLKPVKIFHLNVENIRANKFIEIEIKTKRIFALDCVFFNGTLCFWDCIKKFYFFIDRNVWRKKNHFTAFCFCTFFFLLFNISKMVVVIFFCSNLVKTFWRSQVLKNDFDVDCYCFVFAIKILTITKSIRNCCLHFYMKFNQCESEKWKRFNLNGHLAIARVTNLLGWDRRKMWCCHMTCAADAKTMEMDCMFMVAANFSAFKSRWCHNRCVWLTVKPVWFDAHRHRSGCSKDAQTAK